MSPVDRSHQAGRHFRREHPATDGLFGQEVDGALTTQKIRGESSSSSGYTSREATFYVRAKSLGPAR